MQLFFFKNQIQQKIERKEERKEKKSNLNYLAILSLFSQNYSLSRSLLY